MVDKRVYEAVDRSLRGLWRDYSSVSWRLATNLTSSS